MNQIIKINGLYTKKCEYCDNYVKATKYKSCIRNTCSYKCSNTLKWNTSRKEALTISIKCNYCNGTFTMLESVFRARTKYQGVEPKYCSRKCSNSASKNIKVCVICQATFNGRNTIKTCSKRCSIELRKIVRGTNGTWCENGYIIEYNGTKNGIKQHRRIMQDYLGRELTNDEVVHHVNGVRDDNRIENLELTTLF